MLPQQATTTIETLREIPVNRPATAGADWRGVQHGRLVDEVLRQLTARGHEVWFHRFWAYRLGADLDASFVIESLGGLPHKVLSLSVSNAKRKQLRFYVGGYDQHWGGRYVTNAFYARNRYTYKFKLEEEIEEALDRWEQDLPRQDRRLARMRGEPVNPEQAVEFLLRALEQRELIKPTRVIRAVAEFRDSPVRSLYGLGRAFSDSIEDGTPVGQLDALYGFHQLITGPNEKIGEPVGTA